MKPRVRTMLLLIVAGAIVNVAVAWGYTLKWRSRIDQNVWLPIPDAEARSLFARFVPDGWPPYEGAYGIEQWYRAARVRLAMLSVNNQPEYYTIWDYRCGWPAQSLGSVVATHRAGSRHSDVERYTIKTPDGLSWIGIAPGKHLPLRPIWPGFAINTVFYAAILWLLFAAPFALRRRSRIKRGLCPACGYQVGTSSVCTECGKPVTAKTTASLADRS